MKIGVVIAITLGALAVAPGAGSSGQAAAWWSEFDATLRLETGRFASANDVDAALCLGYGPMRVTKYGEKKFRSFDCSALSHDSSTPERQLTLAVTGPTTFKVTWLKPQTCTPAP